jgi:hypothetical protein
MARRYRGGPFRFALWFLIFEGPPTRFVQPQPRLLFSDLVPSCERFHCRGLDRSGCWDIRPPYGRAAAGTPNKSPSEAPPQSGLWGLHLRGISALLTAFSYVDLSPPPDCSSSDRSALLPLHCLGCHHARQLIFLVRRLEFSPCIGPFALLAL